MYKVIKGAVHHKDKVYRKDSELPVTFTNKEGYKHVALVAVKRKKKAKVSK